MFSPYAKSNHVDHTVTDQTSVLRFIEDNWHTGRIGGASFDARAGSIRGMFDFKHPQSTTLLLDPATGRPTNSPSDTAGTSPSTARTTAATGSEPASTGPNSLPVMSTAVPLLAVGAATRFALRRSARRRA